MVVSLVRCTTSINNLRNGRWFLKPMPTGRAHLSVATTQSAIVASGGVTDVRYGKTVYSATVEVYNSETSQWHTADPLPIPCGVMTSVIIADTWYQLGGIDTDWTPLSSMLLSPPSFREPPHLLTSQLATHQSGRPSLTPRLSFLLQQA